MRISCIGKPKPKKLHFKRHNRLKQKDNVESNSKRKFGWYEEVSVWFYLAQVIIIPGGTMTDLQVSQKKLFLFSLQLNKI